MPCTVSPAFDLSVSLQKVLKVHDKAKNVSDEQKKELEQIGDAIATEARAKCRYCVCQ